MKEFFQIGEISKIFNISVKTIRYYSDIGILPPAYINPDTGYRYYSIDQFVYIDIIRNYRKMGISLEKISDIMAGEFEVKDIVNLVEDQIKVIDEKIIIYNKIKIAMKNLAKKIKFIENSKLNSPFIDNLKSQKYISFPYVSSSPEEQEINFRKASLSNSNRIDYIYTIYGVSTDAEEYFSSGRIVNKEIICYLPEEDKLKEGNTLLEGKYACIIFDDNVRKKDKYYKILTDYINNENLKTLGNFTEEWIIPHLEEKLESTLIRLKIQIKS